MAFRSPFRRSFWRSDWRALLSAWWSTEHRVMSLIWLVRYATLLGSTYVIGGQSTPDGLALRALLFAYFFVLVLFAVVGLHRPDWFLKPRMKYLQAIIDIAALSVFVYFGGGFRSPLVLFYFAPIVIMTTLFNETEVVKVTAVACLAYFAVYSLEMGSTFWGWARHLSEFAVREFALCVPAFVVWVRGGRPLVSWRAGSPALRNVLAEIEDGVYIVDRGQRLTFVNPALMLRHGEHYLGKTCHEYLCRSQISCDWCPAFGTAVTANRTTRATLLDTNGDHYQAEITHHYPPGSEFAVGFVRDLSSGVADKREAQVRQRTETQRLVTALADTLEIQLADSRRTVAEEIFAQRAVEIAQAYLATGPTVIRFTKEQPDTGVSLVMSPASEVPLRVKTIDLATDSHWPEAECYRTGEIICLTDIAPDVWVKANPDRPDYVPLSHHLSVICIPIMVEARPRGVLAAYGPQRPALDIQRIAEVQAMLNVLAMRLGDVVKAYRAVVDQPLVRRRWLQTLHELSVQLAKIKDPDQLIDFCVLQVRELLHAETAAIFLWRDGRLWRRRAAGVPNDWRADEHYTVGQNLTGQVLTAGGGQDKFGRPVCHNSIDEPGSGVNLDYLAEYRSQLPSGQVRHLLAVPLDGRQGTFGVLRVVNRMHDARTLHPDGFDAEAEDYLVTIASIIAIAIELTGESHQEQTRRELFAALGDTVANGSLGRVAEVAQRALDGLTGLVRFDAASLQVVHGRSLEVVAVRGLGADLCGLHFPLEPDTYPNATVALEQRAIWLHDVAKTYPEFGNPRFGATHIRGWLGVPVLFDDQTLAVITLDAVAPGMFGAAEADIVVNYARSIAPFLRSAQWFSASDDEIRFLRTILHSPERMLAVANLDQMLNLACEVVREAFPADWITVGLVGSTGAIEVRRHVTRDCQDALAESMPDVQTWLARIAQAKNALLVEVLRGQSDVRQSCLLGAPIRCGGDVVGAIALWTDRPAVFDEADQQRLEVICAQLGTAYGTAILMMSTESTLRGRQLTLERYDTLRQAAISLGRTDDLDQALAYAAGMGAAMLDVEDCSIFLRRSSAGVDEAILRASSCLPRTVWSDSVSRVTGHPGQGLTGWAIHMGEPLNLAGHEITRHEHFSGMYKGHLPYLPSKTSHSLLIVPIVRSDRVCIGAIKFENRLRIPAQRFEQEQERLAEAFCAIVAMAIDRSLKRTQLARLTFGLHHLIAVVEGRITGVADLILSDPQLRPLPTKLRRQLRVIISKAKYVQSTQWNLLRGISDPAVARLGILGALDLFADREAERVRLRLDPQGNVRLPLLVEQSLYEIGVEAITNANRYGAPVHRGRRVQVVVGLNGSGGTYTFLVENSGKRCDQAALDDPDAVGLGLMRAIAREIRAQINIMALPMGGVRVEVCGYVDPLEGLGGNDVSTST